MKQQTTSLEKIKSLFKAIGMVVTVLIILSIDSIMDMFATNYPALFTTVGIVGAVFFTLFLFALIDRL